MGKEELVENLIIPVMAKPRENAKQWRLLGTGFFFGTKGHLITCRHVVDDLLDNEELVAYQVGHHRELPLRILHRSQTFDIAVCRSSPPGTQFTTPLIDIYLGHDVYSVGYSYEPRGPDLPPVVERFLKGNVTGIPSEFPNSYELSFPSLTGMSGSPLWAPYRVHNENEKHKAIAGMLYRSHTSGIEAFSEHLVEEDGSIRREVESRIVEFGLAYNALALKTVLHEDFDREEEIEFTHIPKSHDVLTRPTGGDSTKEPKT